MAVITFDNINVEDLDQRLVDSIRAFFQDKGARVSITVKVAVPDTSDKGSLSELLARNATSEIVYRVPSEELDKIVEQLDVDENFDPVSAIKKFATPRHQPEPA